MHSSDSSVHRFAEDLYSKLGNTEDARTCEDIPESGCKVVPGNFLLNLIASFLTKLGDAIVNPKTVLTWAAASAGAPGLVLSLLVPIRESGSMLPQLFIGGVVRQLPIRKWVWIGGSVVQGLAVIGMGFAIVLNFHTVLSLVCLLILFSIARGFCSVASKDVVGKTIPKGNRGRLNGWSASLAGFAGLVIGGLLLVDRESLDGTSILGQLLILGGLTWLIAALVFSQIIESPGETQGANSGLNALKQSLGILRDDRDFSRFVLARALLMCSALSTPFLVALSQDAQGTSLGQLGFFVLASGFASLLSAPLWGQFSDTDSRRVIIIAALFTSGICLAVFMAVWFIPALTGTMWFLPTASFGLAIAHSGVRVGRKTYILDLAGGNKRTTYVAVSNSLIGILLLLAGSLGLLVPLIGNNGMIGLFGLMGLTGAILSCKMKKV